MGEWGNECGKKTYSAAGATGLALAGEGDTALGAGRGMHVGKVGLIFGNLRKSMSVFFWALSL